MRHILWTLCIVTVLIPVPALAQKPKDDSAIVGATRKKLDAMIEDGVDWKDTRLQDCLKELEEKCNVKFRYDMGVSLNQSVTYSSGKGRSLKDVLADMFKDRGLGYIVHRKQNNTDRYEGYIVVKQGDERGDDGVKKEATKTDPKKPVKPETKPPVKPDPKADPPADENKDEKLAASKLKQAKTFLEDGQTADAKEYLEVVIKKYPNTKAAAEAKMLLDKLKR